MNIFLFRLFVQHILPRLCAMYTSARFALKHCRQLVFVASQATHLYKQVCKGMLKHIRAYLLLFCCYKRSARNTPHVAATFASFWLHFYYHFIANSIMSLAWLQEHNNNNDNKYCVHNNNIYVLCRNFRFGFVAAKFYVSAQSWRRTPWWLDLLMLPFSFVATAISSIQRTLHGVSASWYTPTAFSVSWTLNAHWLLAFVGIGYTREVRLTNIVCKSQNGKSHSCGVCNGFSCVITDDY